MGAVEHQRVAGRAAGLRGLPSVMQSGLSHKHHLAGPLTQESLCEAWEHAWILQQPPD